MKQVIIDCAIICRVTYRCFACMQNLATEIADFEQKLSAVERLLDNVVRAIDDYEPIFIEDEMELTQQLESNFKEIRSEVSEYRTS